ncbi:unnamed protein product [Spirodela intermedia]|uniref:Uncharacterized protein n=1 Tax=Spirodela intermedia TaxID=51605 RepID=A0A7I8KJT2_SPIIN|nr:unnamed protein product [Spirodela intermedia]
MEEGRAAETSPGYVDWRNRAALKGKHGGMLAASFVLAAEVLENLAFLANASNLVTYLTGSMYFSPARSATAVTNFMGTAFLLALLGGFLSDAFFTTYLIFIVSTTVEFLGLVILYIQVRSPALKPPMCEKAPCEAASGGKAALLFAGLYVVALGVGGIKGSLPTHGAEQFDGETGRGRRERSTFFNYFVFCLATGGLIAVTFVVWIEDNKGWQWGFAIATISIALSAVIFVAASPVSRSKLPRGSPLTTIAKVVCATVLSTGTAETPKEPVVAPAGNHANEPQAAVRRDATGNPSEGLRFLNRAVKRKPIFQTLACTVDELEQVKVIVRILPIFVSTIMLNCCLAQLSTFSIEQAATMDTKLGSLVVPPASLPIFPVVFIMVLAPLYDHLIIPYARKVTGNESGITHLQRIGVGLVLSILAMAVAALVELKRKRVAARSDMLDSSSPLPISFFWVALQYLFLGSADLFSLAGLLEFFFTEAPWGMRSMATSLSWASLATGYYLSSVLVTIVNGATGGGGRRPWLSGSNLNYYRLERFYWLMCILSTLNFLQYLFWASRYKYRHPVPKA